MCIPWNLLSPENIYDVCVDFISFYTPHSRSRWGLGNRFSLGDPAYVQRPDGPLEQPTPTVFRKGSHVQSW